MAAGHCCLVAVATLQPMGILFPTPRPLSLASKRRQVPVPSFSAKGHAACPPHTRLALGVPLLTSAYTLLPLPPLLPSARRQRSGPADWLRQADSPAARRRRPPSAPRALLPHTHTHIPWLWHAANLCLVVARSALQRAACRPAAAPSQDYAPPGGGVPQRARQAGSGAEAGSSSRPYLLRGAKRQPPLSRAPVPRITGIASF
jgi:hypothetical protein